MIDTSEIRGISKPCSMMLRPLHPLLIALVLLAINTSILRATTVVQYYSGIDNLPLDLAGAQFVDKPGLTAPYPAIQNALHTTLGGSSDFEFARFYFTNSSDCVYWFRASDHATNTFYDSWNEVYWSALVGGKVLWSTTLGGAVTTLCTS